ncbi:hypothetical protein T11_15267, partial [Trichinella zimbabwensis]
LSHAYLNTQECSQHETLLKLNQDACILYSLKYRSLMQYFFVLSNSFFLHFPYFSINMM